MLGTVKINSHSFMFLPIVGMVTEVIMVFYYVPQL